MRWDRLGESSITAGKQKIGTLRIEPNGESRYERGIDASATSDLDIWCQSVKLSHGKGNGSSQRTQVWRGALDPTGQIVNADDRDISRPGSTCRVQDGDHI